MLPTLQAFLAGTSRNAYVRFSGFASLYVRHTVRFGIETIDLANIEASEPGKGAFTALLKHLRQTYPHMGIYVECVLNDRFKDKLAVMGFSRHDEGRTPSFFLSPDMELK
jgi:hypothetical protein